jgi:hypothetical protein
MQTLPTVFYAEAEYPDLVCFLLELNKGAQSVWESVKKIVEQYPLSP